jgi:phenylacetate-CoA ligase
MVSSYHLDQEHLPGIVEEMRRFSPVAVEGYPGSLTILANYLKQHGIRLGVRAVLTSSEQVHRHQRLAMQEGFGAEVFDQYGMTERAASASECPRHCLHVDTECTIVEILRPDGSVCMPGELGEITGTHLTNFSMPLLRYRTSDMASFSAEPCSCGIKSPVVERLHGREEDFVVSASGQCFSPTILTFPFDTANDLGIEESQIVQTVPGHLTVRLVPIASYPDRDLVLAKRHIADGLSQRLGATFRIDFEVVARIERQARGKFRWIISGVSGGASSR